MYEILDILSKISHQAVAAILCVFLMMLGVVFILKVRIDHPFSRYSLQIIGLTVLVPAVVIMTYAANLSSEVIACLLGVVIGYIIGTSRRDG